MSAIHAIARDAAVFIAWIVESDEHGVEIVCIDPTYGTREGYGQARDWAERDLGRIRQRIADEIVAAAERAAKGGAR